MPEITSGQPVYGRDFPPSGYDQDWTLQPNIASTAYASGTPEVAVNVTAPSSGRVLVCIGAGIRNNGVNTDTVIVTYRVLEDHSLGPVHTAESAYRGVTSLGAGEEEFSYQGNYALEEDLIPGRNYYFQMRHRVTAPAGTPTSDIASRNILIIPMP